MKDFGFWLITVLLFALMIVGIAFMAGSSSTYRNNQIMKMCKENNGKLIYVSYTNSYNCEYP